MKSTKYYHQTTCSGLKENQTNKERSPARAPVPSPARKSEMKFDDEASDMIPLRRHPPARATDVRTHPHNTFVEPRLHRGNMRKERMAK